MLASDEIFNVGCGHRKSTSATIPAPEIIDVWKCGTLSNGNIPVKCPAKCSKILLDAEWNLQIDFKASWLPGIKYVKDCLLIEDNIFHANFHFSRKSERKAKISENVKLVKSLCRGGEQRPAIMIFLHVEKLLRKLSLMNSG